MTIKKERVEHRRKAPDTSNISLVEMHKQAAFLFAQACHVNKCHHERDGPEHKSLSVLLGGYKGDGLPSLDLSNKLTVVIPEVCSFDKNDFLYIESCLKRFYRGVPIDLDRLEKCRKQVFTYEQSYKKLLRIGVIKIIEGHKLSVNFEHPSLATQTHDLWPRNRNGRLIVELATLKGLTNPVAQCLYRALTFPRYKSLLRFKVSGSGLHHFYANPFGSASGREAPRGNAFLYLPKEISNFLLSPRPGHKIFSLDFVAQEIGAVAALAGDDQLWSAYKTGDVYQELKNRSPLFSGMRRKKFKILCISHLYGMTMHGIKNKFKTSAKIANQWHTELRKILFDVNDYLDVKASRAIAKGYADVNGFRRSIDSFPRFESIRNFFVQATCAQILRKLCLYLDQSNIPTIFANHDCVACEVPSDDEEAYALIETLMGDASESVLGTGYRLLVDCEFEK